MKSLFLRFVSVALVLFVLPLAGKGSSEPYDVKDPDACVLNFSILSDSHIEGNNFARYKIFNHALQNVTKNQSGNDAIVFLGDNTMNGQHIENMLFHGTAALLLRNEKVLPVMGNHDIGNGQGDYAKLESRWYDYTKAFFGRELEHPYYCEVIDGCYFIILGTEEQTVYEMQMSDAQFRFLEDALARAAKSGKPAFVFAHFPMDYATDATGEETDRLTNLLAEYNKTNDLFVFVGHTHMPLYLFWSFHNFDGFPETYLPRLTDLGGENDNEIIDSSGIGMEVEVYENEVVLRGRNFYRGEWKYDTEDKTMCEVTYPLKNPITK